MHTPQVIVSTGGTQGDLLPFLRMAQAIQRRGMPVIMLAPEVHEEQVRAVGLEYASNLTAQRYHEVLNNPQIFDPYKGLGVLFAGIENEVLQGRELLLKLAGQRPTLVLAHPLWVFSAGLARLVQPRMVVASAYLAPSNLRTVHDLNHIGVLPIPAWLPKPARKVLWQQADQRYVDPIALTGLNRARARLGLPAVTESFLQHMQSVPDVHVGLFPSWWGPTQVDWPQPFLDGGFTGTRETVLDPLPPGLEAFLSNGPMPLLMTLGTGHRHAAAVYAAGVAAAQTMGRRLICLTQQRQHLPSTLPDSVFWAPWAPLHRLLGRVSAILHHGGIGTTAEALRCATPQLVLPFAFDQFDNAHRVASLGVGLSLAGAKADAPKIVEAVTELMGTVERIHLCHQIARLLPHDPSPDVMAERLLAWALPRLESHP